MRDRDHRNVINENIIGSSLVFQRLHVFIGNSFML